MHRNRHLPLILITAIGVALLFLYVYLLKSKASVNSITRFLYPLSQATPDVKPSWKTYVDEEHGFSFNYPDTWKDFSNTDSDVSIPEPSGISVSVNTVENCTNAADYLKDEVIPFEKYLSFHPLNVNNLDGFVVEDMHLDHVTPGPEAYIIHCPNVLRFGFNPTGLDSADETFQEILASIKLWKPSE
jgi:hypothetical protein